VADWETKFAETIAAASAFSAISAVAAEFAVAVVCAVVAIAVAAVAAVAAIAAEALASSVETLAESAAIVAKFESCGARFSDVTSLTDSRAVVCGHIIVVVANVEFTVATLFSEVAVALAHNANAVVSISESTVVSAEASWAIVFEVFTTVFAEDETSSGAHDAVGVSESVGTAGVVLSKAVVGVVVLMVSTDVVVPDTSVATLIVVSGLRIVVVVVEGFTVPVIVGGVVNRVGGAIAITIEVSEFGSNGVGISARVSDLIALNGMITEVIVVSTVLNALHKSVNLVANTADSEKTVLVAVAAECAEAETATSGVSVFSIVVSELTIIVSVLFIVVSVFAINAIAFAGNVFGFSASETTSEITSVGKAVTSG